MKMMLGNGFFSSTRLVFGAAVLLRAVLLIYGHFQDQFSPLKYTDIDYFVFTDAARYVRFGMSPYFRDTYRYTPLLAWALIPSTFGGWWFVFGKALFALSDVAAGWFIYKILRSSYAMPNETALKYSSLWLLNPMVAQISTRGSSEGLLALMVMILLWATLQKKFVLAGCFLGLAVHFKIYPFIYAASIVWWMDDSRTDQVSKPSSEENDEIAPFFNEARATLALASFMTFTTLNCVMFLIYESPFIEHTYYYHLIRTDHRHNFSPYNLLLYLNSSPEYASGAHPEALAFIPQIVLSAIIIPFVLAKKDLPSCMLAQTFAFVTFNKVCTSQYFLWYLIFLPFFLPISSFMSKKWFGMIALALWIIGQAMWLQQGYQLEFIGKSTFMPGLWLASMGFFIINVCILVIIISDVRRLPDALKTTKTN